MLCRKRTPTGSFCVLLDHHEKQDQSVGIVPVGQEPRHRDSRTVILTHHEREEAVAVLGEAEGVVHEEHFCRGAVALVHEGRHLFALEGCTHRQRQEEKKNEIREKERDKETSSTGTLTCVRGKTHRHAQKKKVTESHQ